MVLLASDLQLLYTREEREEPDVANLTEGDMKNHEISDKSARGENKWFKNSHHHIWENAHYTGLSYWGHSKGTLHDSDGNVPVSSDLPRPDGTSSASEVSL
ncbi:hypothetical protein Tcan_05664 [Toxocara canis]|uniref:Uncharacterized protein n=1 Tax=Toxocara canis TaxID=6265 RepID=A0A0B2UXK8_TOXCA|nr:hypothetical protein Tcan_05664 [Toxocara canis]